jgi:hypothetical protein
MLLPIEFGNNWIKLGMQGDKVICLLVHKVMCGGVLGFLSFQVNWHPCFFQLCLIINGHKKNLIPWGVSGIPFFLLRKGIIEYKVLALLHKAPKGQKWTCLVRSNVRSTMGHPPFWHGLSVKNVNLGSILNVISCHLAHRCVTVGGRKV